MLKNYAIVGTLFLLFGIVGAMDSADEQATDALYCEGVRAYKQGDRTSPYTWPDYRETYDEECTR